MDSSASSQPCLRLALPPALYATTGRESRLYFDNLIAAPSTEGLAFRWQCELGRSEPDFVSITPTAAETGTYPVHISVRDTNTGLGEQAQTTLHVSPPVSNRDTSLKLLLVGDSLTHRSAYPAQLRELLSGAGIESVFLGTHTPEQAPPGIAHEGYGGWTWERFVNHYEPEAEQPPHRATSPFVFADEHGEPQLDVTRYLSVIGDTPDVVTFFLGINDLHLADWRNDEAVEKCIDEVFGHAETLLKAFRGALPEAHFGVIMTPAPNGRDAAYVPGENYDVPRHAWLKLRHRLVERQITQFAARESEGVSLVPVLGIDVLGGYPENDDVHPNETGYQQLANDIYAWLNRNLHLPASAFAQLS